MLKIIVRGPDGGKDCNGKLSALTLPHPAIP
jgi:hypothetical protein